jgi:hypothetical protein
MSKTLFIHILKSAGTSIVHSCPVVQVSEEYIHPDKIKEYDTDPKSYRTLTASNAFAKHAPYSYLDPEKLKEFSRIFSVVRNPWSRLVSLYHHADAIRDRISGKWYNQEKITWDEFILRMDSFKMTSSFYWYHPYDNWGLQSAWVAPGVDILRFENIEEELKSYFGQDLVLSRNNIGQYDKNYKDYYTKEQREKVAEWFKIDIERWGFTFESSATKNYWKR